jgi:NADPH-dependent 2,4-dienoyl-CoA reductase/sulfur reductase-like enzyme
MRLARRDFLAAGLASLGSVALGGRGSARATAAKVVVIGAGFGGATAAKYIRKLSEGRIDVTLVEREREFVSCPMSNLVIGGSLRLSDITRSYAGLEKWGVRRVRDEALSIDPAARRAGLASGASLPYDRLILSPGIDFMWEQVPALKTSEAQASVPHAWKAGPQTLALRRQLEAMPDGGIFALHIPKMPYRCAPAPYERACQVAFYFSARKPRSKVIVLDANDDLQAERALFTAAWSERYKGFVEYRPNSELVDVDLKSLTAKLEFEDVKADVLNVIPPQYAGAIARQLGMANANARFCQVDFLTYESTVQPNIHVLGDAIQTAPLMAKAAQMANRQAKVCAAAVVSLLSGGEVNRSPTLDNACFSYIDNREAARIASVHRYDATLSTMVTAPGSTQVSGVATLQEGIAGSAWAKALWADTLL